MTGGAAASVELLMWEKGREILDDFAVVSGGDVGGGVVMVEVVVVTEKKGNN